MKTTSFYQSLFIRIFLILLGTAFCFWLYQKQNGYTLFFIGFVLLVLLSELYFKIKKHYEAIDRVLLAMIYDDFSLKTEKKQTDETMQNLQNLYQKLQQQQQDHESKEVVYLNILNNLESGIVILEKNTEGYWDIFLINDYFSNYFSIPKIHSWQNLQKMIPNLSRHIESIDFKESKSSIDIRLEGEEKQTFMLQTSKTQTLHKEYYIIMLDSIQRVMDKKEKDTWLNLMKIISHELMNSLTPIHSLAYNIQEILEEEPLTAEDLDDINISIKTIVNRSNHLQYFVENYRKLTMLPTPNKSRAELKASLESSIQVMQPLIKKNNINLQSQLVVDFIVNWDHTQMEQVFINLLTNAIHAVADQPEKNITIQTSINNQRLVIEFTDSGLGIPEEIKEKVFIPFYTTRKDGAGIGLPLSKNMVEMHGGYLIYRRKDHKTIFSIHLPLQNLE
ncbi:PAS domain-containing sensor histidine kinase [Flavobacterium sp. NKUCC04_CG]|uniref:sensor histidine kinase n=1 Tax=Flavobacterium sp. NKUCC04_CG TaxID=2842121 RepID=UPI001C5A9EB4|nr:ATP-binding protein [Flavobacterium sp. NKUCC04_CG]MBW3518939.1 HAMP domain-containing histidine kinase [Flavobacterium sp. NKUCC04_CG]